MISADSKITIVGPVASFTVISRATEYVLSGGAAVSTTLAIGATR